MDGWDPCIAACEFLGTLILVITLQWASVERARVHREWARERRTARAPLVDWYVALGLAVGCV